MNDKPVALVTGANRGIGLRIAKDLAVHGFTVLVGSRNLKRGESAAASIGRDAHGLQLDVTDQASIDAAAARVRHELGRLDVLVNNAGASDRAAWTDDLDAVTDEMWDRILDTDLRGTFRCCRAAARVMKKGKIINVTSIPALTGEREGIIYSIAKAGVLGMTKSLAMLLAPRIQVNCMALGSIATGWVEWLPPALRKSYAAAIPVGRFGRPEEVGALALFLAGNDWISGQTYVLDGGETRV